MRLAQEADARETSLDWAFVKLAARLKQEFNESVDDNYPWIRFYYYLKCLKEDAEEAKKQSENK